MSSHPLSAASIFSVKGWVAVVTGGGTGLGLAAARAFAVNGAKVYITGRQLDVLEKNASTHGTQEALGGSGGSLIPIQMDVTSKDSIEQTLQIIQKDNKYVNLLLNNAGIGTGRAAAAASDGADVYGKTRWNESIDDDFQNGVPCFVGSTGCVPAYLSNCTQVYFMTPAFMPLLENAKSSPTGVPGNVINTASISGFTKCKEAVIHLTRMLACELSHENIGIRVNGISPESDLGMFDVS